MLCDDETGDRFKDDNADVLEKAESYRWKINLMAFCADSICLISQWLYTGSTQATRIRERG